MPAVEVGQQPPMPARAESLEQREIGLQNSPPVIWHQTISCHPLTSPDRPGETSRMRSGSSRMAKENLTSAITYILLNHAIRCHTEMINILKVGI